MTQDNWTSIKESLPREGFLCDVLCLMLFGNKIEQMVLYFNGRDKFYVSMDWPNKIFHNATEFVTHWQPLPPPPNKQP